MEPGPDALDQFEYNELSPHQAAAFLEFVSATTISPSDLEHFEPPTDLTAFVSQSLNRLITAFNLDMRDETPVKRTIIAIAVLHQNFVFSTNFSPTAIIQLNLLWENLDLVITFIAVAKVREASAKL